MNNSQPYESLTRLRRSISSLIEGLKGNLRSSEQTLAMRSLQMAKAHLGKVLSAIGAANPYAHDESRRLLGISSRITPEAHREEGISLTGDRVEDDDRLRLEIGAALREMEELYLDLQTFTPSGEAFDHYHWARRNLFEARFWLGYDLGVVRDAQGEVADA